MNGSQTILNLKKIITEFRKNIKESPPERRPKLKESLKIMKRTLKRQKEQLQLEKKLSKEHEKTGLLAYDLLLQRKRLILMSEVHYTKSKKRHYRKVGIIQNILERLAHPKDYISEKIEPLTWRTEGGKNVAPAR